MRVIRARWWLAAATTIALARLGDLDGYFVSDDLYWVRLFGTMPLDALGRSFFEPAPLHVVGPVLRAHFRLARALFDLSYPGHHALALLVHVGAATLLYPLARELGARRPEAAAAALLFGLAPSSGALVFLSTVQHAYLLVGVFAMHWAYLRELRAPTPLSRAALPAGLLLALSANEAGAWLAITTPLIAFAGRGRRTAPAAVALIAGATALWILPRYSLAHLTGAASLTGFEGVYQIRWDPSHLGAQAVSVLGATTGGAAWVAGGGLIASLVFTHGREGGRVARYAALFTVLASLPFVMASHDAPARYGYVPSAGVALALAALGAAVRRRADRWPRLARGGGLVLLVTLLGLCHLGRAEVARTYAEPAQQLRLLSDLPAHLPAEADAVVLFGVPYERAWPGLPNNLAHALPLWLPDRALTAYVVTPGAEPTETPGECAEWPWLSRGGACLDAHVVYTPDPPTLAAPHLRLGPDGLIACNEGACAR